MHAQGACLRVQRVHNPNRSWQSFRTAGCSVGQPEVAGYVLTAVAPMRAQRTWEVYGGVGRMRMSQKQHKQRHKARGPASLQLHADLKQHRPGVGTVSYARQTLCYLDFLACHSKLHKSLPESCFVALAFVTNCAEQRGFSHSPTRSADTTLRIVEYLTLAKYPQEPPFWALCHEEGHTLSRAPRPSRRSIN